MVKKLYKYEYRSYWLWNVLIYGALIASALLLRLSLGITHESTRISTIFMEESSILSSVLTFASTAVYFITLSAGFTLVIVMPIIRFYKNLLSSEGYLTLSIPVTPATHIICKTVVAYTYIIGLVIAFLASVAIILTGWGDSIEIFKNIGNGIVEMFRYIGEQGALMVISCIALLVALILAPIATLMLYYFCLSMGMLFGKYKIIGAVVFYIGLEMVFSVLVGTLEIILMPFITLIESGEVFMLIFSLVVLVWVVVQICVFFAFSHHMFKHKVNI